MSEVNTEVLAREIALDLLSPKSGLKGYIENIVDRRLSELGLMPKTACGNCEMYDRGLCLKYNVRVPVEARAAGCEHWIERIPF